MNKLVSLELHPEVPTAVTHEYFIVARGLRQSLYSVFARGFYNKGDWM